MATRKAAPKSEVTGKTMKAGISAESLANRHQIFALEYLANGNNATHAAIKAGYSPASAHNSGHRMLKEPEVMQIIKDHLDKRMSKMELSADRTMLEIARLAYLDPRKLFKPDGSLVPIQDLDDDSAAAIAGMDLAEIGSGEDVIGVLKKIKFADKNSALDKAAKIHKLYSDAVQVTQQQGFTVEQMMKLTSEELAVLKSTLTKMGVGY